MSIPEQQIAHEYTFAGSILEHHMIAQFCAEALHKGLHVRLRL